MSPIHHVKVLHNAVTKPSFYSCSHKKFEKVVLFQSFSKKVYFQVGGRKLGGGGSIFSCVFEMNTSLNKLALFYKHNLQEGNS